MPHAFCIKSGVSRILKDLARRVHCCFMATPEDGQLPGFSYGIVGNDHPDRRLAPGDGASPMPGQSEAIPISHVVQQSTTRRQVGLGWCCEPLVPTRIIRTIPRIDNRAARMYAVSPTPGRAERKSAKSRSTQEPGVTR